MNKFKNLFRHNKTRRDEEEDHFVGKENQKPTGVHFKPQTKYKKGMDALDVTATACYHTQVAPKTKRGPKSCPGGMSDDLDGGHVNRSFETEIHARGRRPDFARESSRQKRSRHAMSEYGGPVQSSKMSHIPYTEVEVPSDGDEDMVVKDLRRKLHFSVARKQHYKIEYQECRDREKAMNKANQTQEEYFKRQLQDKDIRIRMLEQALHETQRKCSCQQRANQSVYQPHPFGQPSFNQSFYPSFAMEPSGCPTRPDSSVISDPQPPNFAVPSADFSRFDMPSTAEFSRFENEDRDETKIFRSRESQSSLMRSSSLNESF